ncbi:MAG: transposase [Chloracidobacterium sp.]|nr:transposase [Chloracidobacterium sp.]
MADTKNTTNKTFEYRIRPNKKFVAACEKALGDSRFVYNCALEQRIRVYNASGKTISFYEQSRQLTEARNELPEIKSILRTIQSDALERLDEAFEAFFRRLKRGEKPGFPRFKGAERYHTFSQKYEKVRPCPIKGDKLTVPGVGTCRVRLSRPVEGRCRQLRITRRADGWYVLLVCEIPKPEPLPPTGQTVGVDVGIKSFATLSTGEEIANPRHLKQAATQLAREQRRLSGKVKGSQNRKKARGKVALRHLKVQRARKHFHHEVAAKLVNRFDRIAVEDLNIRGMVKNHCLAKSILDVAWGQFFAITKSKAESAGRTFERVNPRYTSQTCSNCGHIQKMPLAIRVYECEKCGFVCGRDHNAAINLDSVRASGPEPNACGERRRSKKQERDGNSQSEPRKGGD